MARTPPSNPTGRLLERRSVYTGPVVDLSVDRVELPNGHAVELDMIRHPGAAAVVPFVSEEDIFLIRQYRWAAGGFIYEIPAGKLDAGTEDPAVCARRELIEEIGHAAGELIELGPILTTPGFTDEVIHLFLARGLRPAEQRLDRDEVIQIERLPFATALEWAREGRITDAKTLCGLLRADLYRRHARPGRRP